MVGIRLLGPVQLTAGDAVFEVGPPQRCVVLAALAVDAGSLVTTDTLVDRVWGDNPAPLARRTVHAHIARLRRLLEQTCEERPGAPQIRRRAGGYELELQRELVDLLVFRDLLVRADQSAGDSHRRVTAFRAALRLWRGEPLAGLTGAWVARTREGWHRLHLQAARDWADAEIELGRAAVVLDQLSELLHTNPFDEHLTAVLMRALHHTGDQAAALRLYTATRARLVDELGAEPGPELRRAHREVLQGGMPVPGAPRRGTWPHQVGVPPPRADGFQHRALADEVSAAPAGSDGPAARVLSGLGGVGKTQLAAETARGWWAAGHLDLLIWVSALSRDAVVTGYARAADDLALGPAGEPPEQAATRLLTWLATTGRRWLVVLDDVGHAADVRGLWPPVHPTGRTIVTTRRRDAALSAGRALLEVGVFEPDEAAAYLSRALPSRLADDVAGVVADLGALPLALSHAAAYMIDQDITCGEYRVRFADRGRRLAVLFPDQDSLFDGTARTVATTWTISIAAADALDPPGLATPLLALAALVDANGIPETIFTSVSCRRHLHDRLGRTYDETTVRDGLRRLHRFNLIDHDRALVRIHALVQRAVRESLDERYAHAVAGVAADAVLETWPVLDHHTGHLLRANAVALHRHTGTALWDPHRGAHPIHARTIDSLGAAAQLSEAVAMCGNLREQAAKVLGPAHPDTFRFANLLYTWTGDADRSHEAVARLAKLVPDAAAALGPDHPVALDLRHTLGYQRGLAGDPRAAVRDLSAVASDRVRVLGPAHPDVLTCRNQLAYWRCEAGDARRARAELEQLLPDAIRVLGPHHHETLEIRGNLAQCRGHCGDIAGAIADLTALLEDSMRIAGSRPRTMSVLRHNLAVWRWRAGQTAEAAQLLTRVLAERLDLFGPEYRDTLVTRHALAAIAAEQGDPAAADALEAVLADLRRTLGPEHRSTLNVRRDLACLHGRLGDAARAARELREVHGIQRRLLGDEHADTRATQAAYRHWRGCRT